MLLPDAVNRVLKKDIKEKQLTGCGFDRASCSRVRSVVCREIPISVVGGHQTGPARSGRSHPVSVSTSAGTPWRLFSAGSLCLPSAKKTARLRGCQPTPFQTSALVWQEVCEAPEGNYTLWTKRHSVCGAEADGEGGDSGEWEGPCSRQLL